MTPTAGSTLRFDPVYDGISASLRQAGQAITFGEENRYYYFSAESGFVFLVSSGNLEIKYYPENPVDPVKDKIILDSLYSSASWITCTDVMQLNEITIFLNKNFDIH